MQKEDEKKKKLWIYLDVFTRIGNEQIGEREQDGVFRRSKLASAGDTTALQRSKSGF